MCARAALQDAITSFTTLGSFALLVRLDVECNALSCNQVHQPGPLDCGDVNEHIAAAVIGRDEAIATRFLRLSVLEISRAERQSQSGIFQGTLLQRN